MNKGSGVQIRSGPSDWTIIQQQEGSANLALSGTWALPALESGVFSNERVQVRIVHEFSNQVVIPWTRCELYGAQEWRVVLQRVPAGGLYRIESGLIADVSGGAVTRRSTRGDMIHHLGVGDLWVVAGQSNAVGYGQGAIYDPPTFGVHLFRDGKWDVATHPLSSESFFCGHSPMLSFAKTVYRETGWPIGLLQTARGGSPLRSWNPYEEGDLYANMVRVVKQTGGKVRGIVWYQGCSDCNPEASVTYLDRFTQVVDSWRRDLGDPLLPVLTVQLNRTMGIGGISSDSGWGTVREAQRQAARRLEQVYVVPAIDCPLSDFIHISPAGNVIIGERLARAALSLLGRQSCYQAPDIMRIERMKDGNHGFVLTFDHVVGELSVFDPIGTPFSVEDSQGRVDLVQWRISGRDEIELILAREPVGRACIHGMYEKNPSVAAAIPVDLGTGLPLLAFYNLSVD
ncbi:sialate O-acetylesterase [Paenibacillus koleovorans]|uniref:sialate O-acetylesterase n=1 Tax=Paenibacillus koleovorans TaxID=121608 RepID=UPI000FDC8B27|nr:sialate O-acetylesterase [Paenibacillus koleovorans]